MLNWEKGKSPPLITHLGAVIAFLGYYPFPDPVSIGERLFRERRIHGWSIHDAALGLGVDPSTWRDWEHGRLILFSKHRAKVAKLLGIDEQFVAGEMRARWSGKDRHWVRLR